MRNGRGTRYVDCSGVALDFGHRFSADLREGGQRVFDQTHCFAACRLALEAQALASRDAASG